MIGPAVIDFLEISSLKLFPVTVLHSSVRRCKPDFLSPHQSQFRAKDIFPFTAFYVTYRIELMFAHGQILLCLTQRTIVYLW